MFQHPIGLCYRGTGLLSNFIYINIPKNASSLTRGKLVEMGWQEENYLSGELGKTVCLVVLRDPLTRWVSGIAEWAHRQAQTKLNEDFWQKVYRSVAMDSHTLPQCDFLKDIPISSIVAFWLDHNYKKKFSQYFQNTLGIENTFEYSDNQNVSTDLPHKMDVINFLNEKLQDMPTADYIRGYYQQDYDLIKRCGFYG